MSTSTATPELRSKPPVNAMRGLGWDTAIDSSAGPVEGMKGGPVPGFTSELILYPSTDSGVFVSFNSEHGGGSNPTGALALQVAQAVYQDTQTGSASGS